VPYHTRAFVEFEDWPRAVLIAAQRAGYFAPAPIWDDLRSFDARAFHGAFDIVLAGYPCQSFSAAGKRGGADDPRHLWPEVARVIAECRPEWVFLENVPGHVSLGLETVLRELWGMGYTPAAGLFSAVEVGAPHQRMGIFVLAHTDEPASRHRKLQPGGEQRLHPEGRGPGAGHHELVDAQGDGWREGWTGPESWLGRHPTPANAGGAMANTGAQNWKGSSEASITRADGKSRMDILHYRAEQGFTLPGTAAAEPALRRMADGLAHRARALRLLGNGVHPLAAAHAWRAIAVAHGLRPLDLAADGRTDGPSADDVS